MDDELPTSFGAARRRPQAKKPQEGSRLDKRPDAGLGGFDLSGFIRPQHASQPPEKRHKSEDDARDPRRPAPTLPRQDDRKVVTEDTRSREQRKVEKEEDSEEEIGPDLPPAFVHQESDEGEGGAEGKRRDDDDDQDSEDDQVEEFVIELPISENVLLKGHDGMVFCMDLDPSCARIASGSRDNSLKSVP